MNPRTDRHESRDDYLEAILNIRQKKGYCRSIDVAETLDVSKPSVSVAMGKLIADGYVIMDEQKMLFLTELGLRTAEETLEKHHYFKQLLLAADVDEATAEKEACAIEHTISRETFEKLTKRYPIGKATGKKR